MVSVSPDDQSQRGGKNSQVSQRQKRHIEAPSRQPEGQQNPGEAAKEGHATLPNAEQEQRVRQKLLWVLGDKAQSATQDDLQRHGSCKVFQNFRAEARDRTVPGGAAEEEKGQKKTEDVGQAVPADAEGMSLPVPLEEIRRKAVNKKRMGHLVGSAFNVSPAGFFLADNLRHSRIHRGSGRK